MRGNGGICDLDIEAIHIDVSDHFGSTPVCVTSDAMPRDLSGLLSRPHGGLPSPHF